MRARTTSPILAALLTSAVCASAAQAQTPAPAAPAPSTGGGAIFGPDDPSLTATVPGTKAQLLPNGMAAAPDAAPPQVKSAIWAANRIIGKPYKYGGGHGKVEDAGYDCSGTVSYALLGGTILRGTPLDSSSFMKWGRSGKGQWVTVFTNPGHAYVVIAGLRLDTSAAGDPSGAKGPRWRPTLRSSKGFKARRAPGL
ncbi:hypothetical protein [Conexibacter sp. SYSU D00693]|uniref:hypothetical protein n=1 Tax=Conexibacter sp. SYSU D00693 TaxID=2812560 RepID=UPI00196B5B5F|nr:hypothetical protein [Conexibacter sp. SYSU D00693]